MTLKITIKELENIVETSVWDAIELHRAREAEKQHAIERDLERRISLSSPQGDGSSSQKSEADDNDDPMNTGAPKRPTGSIPTPQQAQQQQQAPEPAGPIDADAIIDKFNIIRSGKSLNDRQIHDIMKQYIGSLSDGQRTAMFGVLQKIGQIVAPEVNSQRIQAPKEQEPPAMQAARLQMLQQKRETGEIGQQPSPEQQAAPPPTPPQAVGQERRPPEPERTDKGEEDVTPPIRVGPRRR